MAFEPEKLFIGVIDLFAVLLPGALFTFFAQDWLGPKLLGGDGSLDGTTAGVAFLVASYLAGHLLFLAGSILDELVYDRIRSATEDEQVQTLAGGGALASWPLRFIARNVISPFSDEAVRTVIRIRDRYLEPLGASGAINAFQWSKARLSLEHPQAVTAIHRLEADSKFFRSLVVLLLALVPIGMGTDRPAVAGLAAILVLPAFWRYLDQRAKSINQAYWFVIASEAGAPGGARPQAVTATGGGIVHRRVDGTPEFLTFDDGGVGGPRLLQVGTGRPGDPASRAATRQVLTGGRVWARKEADLGSLEHVVDGEAISVPCFLLRHVADARLERVRGRAQKQGVPRRPLKRQWVDLDEACRVCDTDSPLAQRLRAAFAPPGAALVGSPAAGPAGPGSSG